MEVELEEPLEWQTFGELVPLTHNEKLPSAYNEKSLTYNEKSEAYINNVTTTEGSIADLERK